jgi:hypothetical protein
MYHTGEKCNEAVVPNAITSRAPSAGTSAKPAKTQATSVPVSNAAQPSSLQPSTPVSSHAPSPQPPVEESAQQLLQLAVNNSTVAAANSSVVLN